MTNSQIISEIKKRHKAGFYLIKKDLIREFNIGALNYKEIFDKLKLDNITFSKRPKTNIPKSVYDRLASLGAIPVAVDSAIGTVKKQPRRASLWYYDPLDYPPQYPDEMEEVKLKLRDDTDGMNRNIRTILNDSYDGNIVYYNPTTDSGISQKATESTEKLKLDYTGYNKALKKKLDMEWNAMTPDINTESTPINTKKSNQKSTNNHWGSMDF